MAPTRKSIGIDLREACVLEAIDIINTCGVEKLSLREVARRLSISHQTPYRHFESRDHLLAEIVRRAYVDLAAALRSVADTEAPAMDAMSMGFAYVRFAATEPLKYRLMFGGSLPDPHLHSDMMLGARDAFEILRRALERIQLARGEAPKREAIDSEALFAWSTLHGVVSLLCADAIETLDLAPGAKEDFVTHALQKIGVSLGVTQNSEGPLA